MATQEKRKPEADSKILLRDFLFSLTFLEILVILVVDDNSTTNNSNIFDLTAEQILTNMFFHSFIAGVASTIAFTLSTTYVYRVTRVPEDSPTYIQMRAIGAVLVIFYTLITGFTSTATFYIGCVLLGIPLLS